MPKTTSTKSTPKKTSTVTKSHNQPFTEGSSALRGLRAFSYAVWSLVGIMVLALLSVAVFGEGTWVENLNLTETNTTAQEPVPQQPAPPQPTEEQLACVAEEVGEDRFAELQQGAQPEGDEATIIQECLTS